MSEPDPTTKSATDATRLAATFAALSAGLYSLGFLQSDWWPLAGATAAAAAAVWWWTAR